MWIVIVAAGVAYILVDHTNGPLSQSARAGLVWGWFMVLVVGLLILGNQLDAAISRRRIATRAARVAEKRQRRRTGKNDR